ncbi:TetR/AcrR family transcriptional regulator [Hyalangium sp.]|uniref:TetR/AcrR family transcriptional regulator n=1 Tax=Hyalangium sp. TaxID=2028555 RepID=UPI002D399374|nr:TetR/AcrR family transcriptional regulator [Hyalangium sp.]HYH96687.1 TetR/AcrR family transcriptional regulator [Hyalangium sp.]
MPTSTFFRLPEERRERLVNEAIAEFSDRTYIEASLSQIARRARIPKGSVYQYFEDKLDLYRWLLTEEAPRRKREFLGAASQEGDFWTRLETQIERGMAFLVEHPRLARLSAAAADPTANVEVRGLHKAICEAGLVELRAVLEDGAASGALEAPDLNVATRLVATIIGPGLTDVVLQELGAELHEVLASDSLRKRLGPKRRRRLAQQAVLFIRSGLGSSRS